MRRPVITASRDSKRRDTGRRSSPKELVEEYDMGYCDGPSLVGQRKWEVYGHGRVSFCSFIAAYMRLYCFSYGYSCHFESEWAPSLFGSLSRMLTSTGPLAISQPSWCTLRESREATHHLVVSSPGKDVCKRKVAEDQRSAHARLQAMQLKHSTRSPLCSTKHRSRLTLA
jgi:hypothetical protein